jgi:apolipoprotein N-acyltransferase
VTRRAVDRPAWLGGAVAVLASAVLAGLCARGGVGWALCFVLFVPWLRALGAARSMGATMVLAWAMSVAFTAAVLPWFGAAIARLAQVHEAVGVLVLLLLAPLLQPQFFALACMRRVVRVRHGAGLGAIAGAAAWVATEAWWPKLLGDTLGHGLYPSPTLRQAADVVGTAGLTRLLLLCNEAIAAAWEKRRAGAGVRAIARALTLATAVPLVLAAYGVARLASLPAAASDTLRVGLVQSNIVDYERLRRERGTGAVVREVLDTHYAMSHDAVERQRAQVVVWSETVYPTTFGQPKSEAGAELDREIVGIVNAAGVPFVFGTYDRDQAGEYNAAAFVAPQVGLVGFYRKSRPFPLTEHVPAWLDGPLLRQWLPWTGHWRAGQGARVMPLKLADGREVPVLALICLDAVDTSLALHGARLGATAILTMSNDSWFTDRPQGAELHQAVAAFRSIETRLPQFRVTSNGYSAVIDASGTVRAGSRMDERTLVVGELPVPVPPRTVMVAWGDWVPWLCAVLLIGWSLWALASRARASRWAAMLRGVWPSALSATTPLALPASVTAQPPAVRATAALLRAVARLSLLWMAATFLYGDSTLVTHPLAQLRMFAALCLVPEAVAWFLLRASRATLAIEGDQLVLQRRDERITQALRHIATVEPWRWSLPTSGLSLRLVSGHRWAFGIGGLDAAALVRALQGAGSAAALAGPAWAVADAQARTAVPRGWLQQPWAKFLVLPFVLAVPAFRLHQHIAYGGTFGELQTYGWAAYLGAFALWWATWVIGVAMVAATLRVAIEAVSLAAAWLRPAGARAVRSTLERLGLAVLYLGLPTWLVVRITSG